MNTWKRKKKKNQCIQYECLTILFDLEIGSMHPFKFTKEKIFSSNSFFVVWINETL